MRQTRIYKYILLFSLSALLLLLSACSENDPSHDNAAGKSSATRTEAASTATTEATTAEKLSENTSDAPSEDTTAKAISEDTADTAEDTTDTAFEATTSEETTETVSDEQQFAELNLVFVTLNIKHGAEGLDTIAEAIRDISPDIIGLEEVDVNCERSGYVDEPAVLAELAGYHYYAFSKAINLGSGEYGTAILSRFPIEYFEVIPLESGSGESRSLGHAVLNVNGLELHAFVTHLSWEDRTLRIKQMETIAYQLQNCKHYVLMGDFNCFDLEDIVFLGGEYYVNRPDRRYTTFRRFDAALDNIVVSKDFTELSSGLSDRDCSDHKLLYAEFLLSVK